jgi:ABC-type transporter Mla subunit MlaD
MLLAQDRAAIAAALSNASNAAGLTDIRVFTQRGLFASRVLEQLGIAQLRDDIDALTTRNPADAERLATALGSLRETVSEMVAQALLLYGREEKEACAMRSCAMRRWRGWNSGRSRRCAF